MRKLLLGIAMVTLAMACQSKKEKATDIMVVKLISDFNQTKINKIDSLVQNLISENKSAGIAYGIQIGDAKPIFKSYGLADISTERKVRNDDQFRIASITKPFTATAIIQLIENCKLSFDDSIEKFFPNFPDGKEITIYRLLSHTSGIPNWYETKLPANTPKSFPMCKEPHKYIEKMHNLSLFNQGEYYSYSNTGYVLLGEIIEIISGKSYEEYLSENIFAPAEMKDTEMEVDKNISEQWTAGYDYDQTMDNPYIAPEQYPMPFSAGALRSTTADLLKFMNAMNSNKLISKELKTKMASYAKVNSGEEVDEDVFYFPEGFVLPERPKGLQRFGYGLGFQKMDIYNSAAIWHGGSIAGFQSVLIHLPKNNTTLVILTNTGNPGGYSQIWEKLKKIITEIK